MLSRPRAVGEVLFSAFLWGFSFAAAKWTLEGAGPYWALSLRFLLAAFITVPWWLARFDRAESALARPAGIIIGATLLLQLLGLQYTSVAKNCFITVLYVVWVPIAEWVWFNKPPSRWHWVWVVVALTGTALMAELQTNDWNRGDVLTLACSFTSAIHILYIESAQPRIKSGFRFNLYQTVWICVLLVSMALLFEPFPALPMPARASFGIAFNAVAVSIVAFWIQIRAQSVLSPSVVSLLFLLESPLAALFGYWAFGETLSVSQCVGGGLILAAAGGTIRSSLSPHV